MADRSTPEGQGERFYKEYLAPLADRLIPPEARTFYDYGPCTWIHETEPLAGVNCLGAGPVAAQIRAIRPKVGRTYRVVWPAGVGPFIDDWARLPGET